MPTAHELVARGAALLDEKLPGWADQIDLDSLEMHDGCACVLGQLGYEALNLDRASWEGTRRFYGAKPTPYALMADHFDIDGGAFGFDNFDNREVSHADLQDAWKGEIVARRTL